jgi:predicted metal-dependent phosphoesterase TrpH
MIDLHIHTTNSDGTDSVEEILKKAEKLNLEYISITDHDTCNGYDDLKKIDVPKIYSGKIIPGIELKCAYKKRTIEILGYNINIEKMKKWLSEFYKDKSKSNLQTKYLNLLYDKCIKMGLKLTSKECIAWNPEVDWASATIYKDLKKYPENEKRVPEDMWNDYSAFTRKYCADPNHILYMDKSGDYPSLEEVINAVKECDGLVFMPHLFIYKWVSEEDKKVFIEEIVENYNIDGIECFYPDFTKEQTEYLLNLCDKNNLFKSGGSDYHGLHKPTIFLGKGHGDLSVPNEIISSWVNENIKILSTL